MAQLSDLNITITLTADQLKAALAQLPQDAGKAGDGIKQGLDKGKTSAVELNQALEIAKKGLTMIANTISSFVQAAGAGEVANAKLNAVLKSTGGAAGMTRESLDQLAQSLASQTRMGQTAVKEAEHMLLTFTQIGKDVFPAATETVLNMSEALGQDTKSSAIQLGKALNDPIAGVTALRRVGVTLTDEQKKNIQVLMQQGRLQEAQKVILSELKTEFGGVAKALGDTPIGKLTQLENAISGIKKAIADMIATAAVPFIDFLKKVVNPIREFLKSHKELGTVVAAVGIGIAALVGVMTAWAAIQKVTAAGTILGTALQYAQATASTVLTGATWALNAAWSASPVGAVVAIVGLLIAAFVALFSKTTIVKASVNAVSAAFSEFWNIVKTLGGGIATFFSGLFSGDWKKMKEGLTQAAEGVGKLATAQIRMGVAGAKAFRDTYDAADKAQKGTQEAVQKTQEKVETLSQKVARIGDSFKSSADDAKEQLGAMQNAMAGLIRSGRKNTEEYRAMQIEARKLHAEQVANEKALQAAKAASGEVEKSQKATREQLIKLHVEEMGLDIKEKTERVENLRAYLERELEATTGAGLKQKQLRNYLREEIQKIDEKAEAERKAQIEREWRAEEEQAAALMKVWEMEYDAKKKAAEDAARDEEEWARSVMKVWEEERENQKKLREAMLGAEKDLFEGVSAMISEAAGKNFGVQQAVAYAQAIVNTYLAMTSALTPYVPVASELRAAAAFASGMASAIKINKQKPEKRESGGMMEAHGFYEVGERGPEFAVNADATRRNRPLLDAINRGATVADLVGGAMNPVTLSGGRQAQVVRVEMGMELGYDKLHGAATKAFVLHNAGTN